MSAKTVKVQVIEPRWGELYDDVLDIQSARDTWREVVVAMTADGTLRPVNAHQIKRLCQFRVLYDKQVEKVAVMGVLLPTNEGAKQQFQYNPHWAAMRQADETICRLEAALGLDPIKRAKALKSGNPEDETKEAQGYLSKVAA